MSGNSTQVEYGGFDMFDSYHSNSSDEEILQVSQAIEYLHDLDILENVSNFATVINLIFFYLLQSPEAIVWQARSFSSELLFSGTSKDLLIFYNLQTN